MLNLCTLLAGFFGREEGTHDELLGRQIHVG